MTRRLVPRRRYGRHLNALSTIRGGLSVMTDGCATVAAWGYGCARGGGAWRL